jgi:hypothetical protein
MSETSPPQSDESTPIYDRLAAEHLNPQTAHELAARSAMTAQADAFAAQIAAEVATTGSLDVAAPTVDARPTVAEQVAALDARDDTGVPDVGAMSDDELRRALGMQ